MCKIPTYPLATTTILEESSAYRGFSSDSPIVFEGQKLLRNGKHMPAGTTDEALQTSQNPRHGENTASPLYAPPVFILFNKGKMPVETAKESTSLGHATTTNPNGFYISLTPPANPYQFIFDAIHSMIIWGSPTEQPGVMAQILFQDFIDNPPVFSTASTLLDSLSGYYDNANVNGVNVGSPFGTTFLVVKGNLTLSGRLIGPTNQASSTILIVLGNLTMTDNDWIDNNWENSSGSAGKIIVFATGNVSAYGIGVDSLSEDLFVAHHGTFYYAANGQETLDDPDLITFVNPNPETRMVLLTGGSVVGDFIPPNTYVAITGSHELSDSSDMTAPFTGTVTYFEMVVPSGAFDDQKALSIITVRFILQYDVVIASTSKGIIISTQDGKDYLTRVIFCFNGTPNIGLHTESFGFHSYVKAMLQTYRVSESTYDIFKAGFYLTMNDEGFIGFSATPYEIEPLPRFIGPTKITKNCLFSLTSWPLTSFNQFEGGMDPYVVEGSDAVSKYRRLQEPPTSTSLLVELLAPYDSEIKYIPLGGISTSGVIVLKNDGARSRVTYVSCVIQPTRQENVIVAPQVNVATGDFPNLTVVYVDRDRIIFRAGKEIYSANYNNQLGLNLIWADDFIIDGVHRLIGFGRGSTNNHRSFYEYKNGLKVELFSCLVVNALPPINLLIKVIWSDMISEKAKFIESKTSKTYRTFDGVVIEGVRPDMLLGSIILPAGSTLLNEMLANGYELTSVAPNGDMTLTQKTRTTTKPIVKAGVIIARQQVIIKYARFLFFGVAVLPIPLADGTYDGIDHDGDPTRIQITNHKIPNVGAANIPQRISSITTDYIMELREFAELILR